MASPLHIKKVSRLQYSQIPINHHSHASPNRIMLSLSSPYTMPRRPPTVHLPRRIRSSRPSIGASGAATFTSFETSGEPHASPLLASEMVTACASFYDVLGIQVGATSEEVKTAYRRLARVCHPDVAAVRRKDSAGEFMRIHAAYSTLSDPQKRAAYDGKLYRRVRPLTAVSSGGLGYRGRSWETDQCW